MRNRIQDLRAQHSWTQVELANRLGVSRQTIISIERGRYDPLLPLAFKIAGLFGIPIEEIWQPDS